MSDRERANDQDLAMPITVFLVDDHAVLREGVRAVLEASGGVEVVGEAGNCADAIARISATRPQVAVIDLQLPDGSGIDVCRAVRGRCPETQCLVLTSFANDDNLFASIRAGAAGFLLKQVRKSDLVDGIRRVAAGHSLIDPALVDRVLLRLRDPAAAGDKRLSTLTPVERTVLGYLVDGLTNRQIAPLVHMSDKTVKNYVSSILSKLGVARRTEAAVYALRSGEYGR